MKPVILGMLGLGLLAWGTAKAADLVVGRATEQSTLDPLFSRTGNNGDTAHVLFDRLVANDANNQMQPALAASWRVVDPLTWEMTLRAGVRFHDGSALTAGDVAFSLERAKGAVNSPASFAGAVRGIVGVDIVSPLVLRVRTAEPTPQLIEQIGVVYIMSRQAADGVSQSAMNGGTGIVGTGPFRLVGWQPGQKLDVVRNTAYWGEAPAWERVSLRFIPLAASRVAALLAGDVDLIGEVGPADVKQLQGNDKVRLFSIASTRLIYLALDSVRAQSPFVTDMAGKPLDKNPLADVRVRQAISKLIDRGAIVGRLLDGSGEAAGQMVPEGLGGYDSGLKPPALDVAGARKLLADAGWGGGFGLTLHGSADRFAKDGAVAQAVGQMLGRGGIKINGVQALPYTNYVTAASRQDYSAFIFSFGTTTSNSAIGLVNVLARYDAAAGMGMFNRSRYSNPAFDAALQTALGTFDEAARNERLRAATRIAIEDGGIVPLYWPLVHWAARKGIAYTPRRDEATEPQYARPAP